MAFTGLRAVIPKRWTQLPAWVESRTWPGNKFPVRSSRSSELRPKPTYQTHGSDNAVGGATIQLPTMDATPDAAVPAGAEHARLQGCGKDDAPLTLYRRADGTRPTAVSSNYSHIPCGYRPGSKFADGILLCDECIAKLQLPAFDPDRPLR